MKFLPTILGLIAFVAACAGLVFFILLPNQSHFWGIAWIVSLLFSTGWMALEWRKILRFFTLKSTRYGANLALIVFLVGGITFFLNYIVALHPVEWDLTAQKVNSLSPQTKKILQNLQGEIKLLFFGRPHELALNEQIFKSYRMESERVQYEMIDAVRSPTRTKSYGVTRWGTVLVEDVESGKRIRAESATEQNITNAIVKLTRAGDQHVYFIEGHGERSLEETDNEALSNIKQYLENDAYKVQTLNLVKEAAIPENADVVVIAGPRTAFFANELKAIETYLEKGGRLIVALDLDLAAKGLPVGAKQLATLLFRYGVQVGDRLLVDPTSKAANVESQILIGMIKDTKHPITKEFPTSNRGAVVNLLMPLASRLRLANKLPEEVKATRLVATTPNAWEESSWADIMRGRVVFNQGSDFRGESDLAYVLEKDKSRIAVFSTSSFFINSMSNFGFNKDLFLNTLAWLANKEALISIRKKQFEDNQLDLNRNILNFIFVFVVVLLPIAILSVGIYIWRKRRAR